MAANYWTSTQRQNWLFEPYEIAEMRETLEQTHSKIMEQYPLPDRRLVFIFIRDRLVQLGKRGLTFRQQCVATALVYLHRYFLFNAIQNVNIYLLTATAFYLASKTEEAPHHIRLVASEARQAWPEYVPSDPARLGEMEFCLISEMHSQLIVWHPYRSLTALKENQKLGLTNEELSLAWSIINDTFMTDLPLTCPPHLIAVTAMFLAVLFVPGKPTLEMHGVMDGGRFASLGGGRGRGRAGTILSTFNQQITDSSVGNTPMSTSTIFKPNVHNSTAVASNAAAGNGMATNMSTATATATATLDRASIKAKTLSAAANSEKMQNIVRFLVDSNIDIDRMIDATQEIISLYEMWEQYNEKTIKDVVAKCIRGQHLDS